MDLGAGAFDIEQAAQVFGLGRFTFFRERKRTHVDSHEDGPRIVVHALDEIADGNTFGVEVHDERIPVVFFELLQSFFFGPHGLEVSPHEQVRKDFEAGFTADIVFFPNKDAAVAVVTDLRDKVFFGVQCIEHRTVGFVHFFIIKIIEFFSHVVNIVKSNLTGFLPKGHNSTKATKSS